MLWTIPVEVQYYLLFVILWWLIKRLSQPLLTTVILVFLALLFSLLDVPSYPFQGRPVELSLFKAMPYFLIGTVLGLLYQKWQAANNIQSNYWCLSIVLLILTFPQVNQLIFNTPYQLWGNLWVLIAISSFFFIHVFLVPTNSKFYAHAIGDFLGKISYSIYLWHLPILYALKTIARDHPMATFPLFLILVIVAATVSFHLIEQPMRRLIKQQFS